MNFTEGGPDFIGRGWAFPPRVDERGRIALTSGTEEIEAAMRFVLLTSPGERVMRPEFGCRAWDYLYEPMNPNTFGLIENAVEEALMRWEPRVTVESVLATEDLTREAVVEVDVTYTVKETNDRRNLVVPYYEIGEES
ncbi:MAG: GPW/gp25 family protein [Dehalococcoidia bacterium]|nr:GPW/gp25 family protein [Dehalococcoidia bacterium]